MGILTGVAKRAACDSAIRQVNRLGNGAPEDMENLDREDLIYYWGLKDGFENARQEVIKILQEIRDEDG